MNIGIVGSPATTSLKEYLKDNNINNKEEIIERIISSEEGKLIIIIGDSPVVGKRGILEGILNNGEIEILEVGKRINTELSNKEKIQEDVSSLYLQEVESEFKLPTQYMEKFASGGKIDRKIRGVNKKMMNKR